MTEHREFPEQDTLIAHSELNTRAGNPFTHEESIQTVLEPMQQEIRHTIETWWAVVLVGVALAIGAYIGKHAETPKEFPSCTNVANDLWGAYLPKNVGAPMGGVFRGYHIVLSGNPFIIELENEEAFGFDCTFKGQNFRYMVIPPAKGKL